MKSHFGWSWLHKRNLKVKEQITGKEGRCLQGYGDALH